MSSAIGGVLVAVFRRVTLELGASGRPRAEFAGAFPPLLWGSLRSYIFSVELKLPTSFSI